MKIVYSTRHQFIESEERSEDYTSPDDPKVEIGPHSWVGDHYIIGEEDEEGRKAKKYAPRNQRVLYYPYLEITNPSNVIVSWYEES